MGTHRSPTIIVLAAGRSRRFTQSGGATHKLDALLGGRPVLQHVLQTVAESGLPFHVVRPDKAASANTEGMGESIARGVTATRDAAGWLILPGDLPLVSTHSLLQVAAELASYPVVVPFWNEKQGHPVGFSRECHTALMALSGDIGARPIVAAYRQAGTIRTLQVDDPGIVSDIDTLDDLAQAEILLRSRQTNRKPVHGKH